VLSVAVSINARNLAAPTVFASAQTAALVFDSVADGKAVAVNGVVTPTVVLPELVAVSANISKSLGYVSESFGFDFGAIVTPTESAAVAKNENDNVAADEESMEAAPWV